MDRFVRIYRQGSSLNGKFIEIWLDTATGVQYIYRQHGYGGGFTVLLGSDGKPLITPQYGVSEK